MRHIYNVRSLSVILSFRLIFFRFSFVFCRSVSSIHIFVLCSMHLIYLWLMVYDVKNVIAIPTRKGNTQLNNERMNAGKGQRD